MKKSLLRSAALTLAAALLSPTAAAMESERSLSSAVSDYTGAGTVVAVIAAGFVAEHPVFAENPPSPAISREMSESVLPGAYVSEKLPAVWDYADGDGDVQNSSFAGTAAASLAAGRFTGAGDVIQEDGTVIHESSFAGGAPDAQLLLFKAAPDMSAKLENEAAARAIVDSLRLSADAIFLATEGLSATEELQKALSRAEEAGVPVFIPAGDITVETGELPVTYTDRGTVTALADLPGVTVVGASADPYSGVSEFSLHVGEDVTTIPYTDSCPDYFDKSFASLMGGKRLPLICVPGVGAAADYENIDASGAVAVILRGEIPFTEKAEAAAAAGALAMIVVDNGSGVSRMALDSAPIPGVMVDAETGELLTRAGESASFEIPARLAGPASFSAAGMSDTLQGSISFLCAGDGVRAAIPASTLLSGAIYADVRGTAFAAAAAAGLYARAREYSRLSGQGTAMSVLLSSVAPVTDAEGNPLSPRLCGAGIVSSDGNYAPLSLLGEQKRPVSLFGRMKYSSESFSVTLYNHTSAPRRLELSAAVFGDGYTEGKDGQNLLSGTLQAMEGVQLYIGDGMTNLCTTPLSLTLPANKSITLTLRLILPEAVRREMESVFWNGFYLDGFLQLREDGVSVSHPFTLFCGDWSAAPLADLTVFEEGAPVIRESRLYTRLFGGSGDGVSYPLGALNPHKSDTAYGMQACIVNPAQMRLGWLELELYALRDIDSIEISFYDSDRRLIFHRVRDGVKKYRVADKANIPLWDFAAADNPDYRFPDGEYSCEIALRSSFGSAGEGVQYMGFTLRVDSEAPRIHSLMVYREGERTLMRVEASDNAALDSLEVYDAAYSYRLTTGEEGSTVEGLTDSVVRVYDVTQYDGRTPLYIEVRDRAGSYATVRLSPAQFEEQLSVTSSPAP